MGVSPTDAVLSYIKVCTDHVTTERCIRVYGNCKPWMTAEVRSLLKAQDTAFKVQKVSTWCLENNLHLNISKTKEVVLDFRRKRGELASLYIGGVGCGESLFI